MGPETRVSTRLLDDIFYFQWRIAQRFGRFFTFLFSRPRQGKVLLLNMLEKCGQTGQLDNEMFGCGTVDKGYPNMLEKTRTRIGQEKRATARLIRSQTI